MKLLLNKQSRYLIDDSQDYHCREGKIPKEEFSKATATSNTGKEFAVIEPNFVDRYEKMKRSAQIVMKKEIGTIIVQTGLNKDSIIIDAGSGSGALCCYLAHIAKKVISYDIRSDHTKVVQKNKDLLDLKNLELKEGDIREGISEKNADVMTLDLPDPWNALETAKNALKRGGTLVLYSPNVSQVMESEQKLHEEFKEDFFFEKTIEIIEREWEIGSRKSRPVSSGVTHTGFLSFVRRL